MGGALRLPGVQAVLRGFVVFPLVERGPARSATAVVLGYAAVRVVLGVPVATAVGVLAVLQPKG